MPQDEKKANLLEKYLLGTNLPHQRLQFGSTHIILEGTQVELRRGTVQHAHAESMPFVFPLGHDPALALVQVRRAIRPRFLKHRNTMAGLFVCEELRVNKSAVRVYFIEFSVATVIKLEEEANRTEFSLPSNDLLLSSTTLGLVLLSSQTHFRSKGRLGLFDAPNFVTCTLSQISVKSYKE